MECCTGGRRELRRLLGENPDWESDLLVLYGFDIWDAIDGRVPVRRAFIYLDRLCYEPRSVWRAKQLGGPELEDYAPYIGWDSTHSMLADLSDQIQFLTNAYQAVNTESHKMMDLDPYPRPNLKKIKKPSTSLDDFASNLINIVGPGNI